MSKKNKKFKEFKKSIKNFVSDEEGFVSKDNIFKIGLGTISALAVLGSFSNSYAGHTSHASHANTANIVEQPVPGTSCSEYAVDHTNAGGHSNHPAY